MAAPIERIKSSIDMTLGGPHRDIFARAVSNVLATELAKITYAQIIDGLPLASVAEETESNLLPDRHPLFDVHTELCPGVLEKTEEFRAQFDPGSLELDANLINAYRVASPGSRAFKTRLIEMIAVAIHEIAVQLFKLGTSLHTNDPIASWVPAKDDMFWRFFPQGAWPTLFRHRWYVDDDQYPDGVADVVGYWAEARILGGVVLFDRRDPATCPDAQPDSIWFHSERVDVTYRMYQLLDEQKQQLLDFLTSESPDLNLLPILGDEKNTRREDPEEPLENTGIYRNIYERKPLGEDDGDYRYKDVWDKFEFPTTADMMRARGRAYDRRAGPYHRR
ncbi:hypothetical protein QBC33DRAFT_579903 [Phialemonium atrogriseum]|uniref:Uncharacterized protein n=1 Tax=Phialemonium atrogriseum TaxID=1093897 RepID=A0AAJ0BZJ9_9PEZI|nr:uncharacterized protein QBC33DRAFT_579903 [Phialemonium atrogriseum]KAK1764961.1 hypothetical protein QBC33DRAFT_579903 [Phialemonium atrogriseum]